MMEQNSKLDIILEIHNLKVYFDGYHGTTQVLNNISFDIRKGEA